MAGGQDGRKEVLARVRRCYPRQRAQGAVLAVSGQSGGHLRRVSIYTALDLPLTLRNSVLPQFGHGLSVDAAVLSSWVASHLEHT
jgi:hypothetical protein